MKSLKAKAVALFLLSAFGLVVFSNGAFADEGNGECTIESSVSPELSDYLKKLDDALAKLKSSAENGSCGTTKNGASVGRAAASITHAINLGLSQDCYLATAAFTTGLWLQSEVPQAIGRDLKLLLSKQEDINLAINQVYQKCGQDIEVAKGKIIEGASTSETENLSTLGETLLRNHTSLICFYRSTAVGRPPLESQFLLTPTNFSTKLESSYGPKAIETCNKKGDVFKRLSEAIDKLGRTAGSIKKGMFAWQSADPKTESAHEEEVRYVKESELVPKLNKAGLYDNPSSATIRAQGRYNLLDGGRWLSGFLDDAGLRMTQMFYKMKGLYTFAPKPEDATNTDVWLARYKNIATLQTDIGQEVLAKYNGLMDQIGNEQLTTDIYEGKLGRIYIELESATKLLEPYRKVAQEICSKGQTVNTAGSGCWPGR